MLTRNVKLIKSTILRSNVEHFFKLAKSDKSSGAYKLVEKLFYVKDFSDLTLTCLFSSFIVVGNKMYFYVMPISPKNRGSTITISSSAVSSGFVKTTRLNTRFEITTDLSSTNMVVDVDTVIISADKPVALINYLVMSGKTYAYALYRAWSTAFPTMHKGIDVDDFIKFIDNLGSDNIYLETFFKEWTFNDYNEWLKENVYLIDGFSLVIKQFFDLDNAKITEDMTNIQQTLVKVLSKTTTELTTWSNVTFKLQRLHKAALNGFALIDTVNKPVISVVNSENSSGEQVLIQFVATMDYYEESKAVGWKELESFANVKSEATQSLLDLGNKIPINALPLNVKYFFPKEIWEDNKHSQFFKDNVKTDIDWFFLMVAYYKGYSIISMIDALKDTDVNSLSTADYESIDDFKAEITDWFTVYKTIFLPNFKTSLATGKSNVNPIDKKMLERNNSKITVNVFQFFSKLPNLAPKPADIDKTVYPWISIIAKGIELDRKKILTDSKISEDELNKYLKDKDWNKFKGKLHKQFGMVQVKNADMIVLDLDKEPTEELAIHLILHKIRHLLLCASCSPSKIRLDNLKYEHSRYYHQHGYSPTYQEVLIPH